MKIMNIEKEKKYIRNYDTLVLSGGGTKGFCTLGALQYIQDNKIVDLTSIKRFISASAGSFLSFCIAIGYTPIEIMVSFCTNNVLESLKINRIENIIENGIYNYSVLYDYCKKMTLEKINYIPTLIQLKNMEKELIVSTYNFTDQKQEYISYINYPDMSCLDAIRMSGNLPFIFNEFKYNNKEYIDGGISDNFPLCRVEKNDKAFAIYSCEKDIVNKDYSMENDKSISNISKILDKIYKILTIPIAENIKKKIKIYEKDINILTIDVDDFKLYRFSLTQSEKLDLFSIGYNKAKDHFLK